MENTINLYRPGTIWQRTRRGKTSTVLLLGTTNEHLSDKVKSKYPEMTVFMDSKGRWCSLPTDVFKEDRVLLKTDVNAESNLLNLLEPRVNADLVEGEEELLVEEEAVKVNENTTLQFLSISNDDLTSAILPALVTYNLRPSLEGGASLVHELILDPAVLSESDASRLFTGTDLETIADISVGDTTYTVHRYLGAYPIVIEGGQSSFYTIYLSTNLDVHVADVAQQQEEASEVADEIVNLSELAKELTYEEAQVLYEQLLAQFPDLGDVADQVTVTEEEDAPESEVASETTVVEDVVEQNAITENMATEEEEELVPNEVRSEEETEVQEEPQDPEPNIQVDTESTLEVTTPEQGASSFVTSFREILTK